MEVEHTIEIWQDTVEHSKKHIHTKRHQVNAYNEHKNGLQNGKILLHVDFSESYKNNEQDEISSAYFGHTTFSILTECA